MLNNLIRKLVGFVRGGWIWCIFNLCCLVLVGCYYLLLWGWLEGWYVVCFCGVRDGGGNCF